MRVGSGRVVGVAPVDVARPAPGLSRVIVPLSGFTLLTVVLLGGVVTAVRIVGARRIRAPPGTIRATGPLRDVDPIGTGGVDLTRTAGPLSGVGPVRVGSGRVGSVRLVGCRRVVVGPHSAGPARVVVPLGGDTLRAIGRSVRL
ncbi:hypothetical protein [Streptomyces sp. NPDC005865]|uniref:hypothetical protein n=1 Tax=Streptomyces sp. NPDC005865 TaxID=3155453 RepID=UPI0033EE3FFE